MTKLAKQLLLVFLVVLTGCKGGEIKMAKWTQKIVPFTASFQAESLIYSVELNFDVDHSGGTRLAELVRRGYHQYTEAAWAAGADWPQPPANVPLIHDGKTVFNKSYIQDVFCVPVSRRLENVPATNAVRVVQLYEGRIRGTHWITSRVQMASEPLYFGLREDGDGKHKAIGVNFEGVARDVPIIIYSVGDVVSLESLASYISITRRITGAVNENNWLAPWNSTGWPGAPAGSTYNTGEFLYLGVTSCTVDKRTRTASLVHEFAKLTSRTWQHIHEWRGYTEVENDTTKRLDRDYDQVTSGAYILRVAGQNEQGDPVPGSPKFSILSLSPILY